MERKIVFMEDDIGRHAAFADTEGQSFRDAGRGDTDEEMIVDLKRNERSNKGE